MDTIITNTVITLSFCTIGFVLIGVIPKKRENTNLEKNKKRIEETQKDAEDEAEKIKKQTSEFIKQRKENIEREKKNKELRLKKLEEIINSKNSLQAKKEEKINEQKLKMASLEEETQVSQLSIKRVKKEIVEKLATKAGKEMEELKEEVLRKNKADLETRSKENLLKIEEQLKNSAEKTAKKIVIGTLQRLCSPTSVETRAVTIAVPKDSIKGNIVGKNGENIMAFEEELPVDVVFNDTPNTISISAFMLVERRVAQKAMEKLVRTKTRIDKEFVKRTIKEAREEIDKELYETGKNNMKKMGITSKNIELCKTIGRLQYRTSYGQNIMKHSMEVGWIAQMLGSEIGANTKTCLLGGFLHDLGKAIDQDPNITDTHDKLTKDLMEKYNFSEEEVHAAWTHHDVEPQKTPEALLVKAADAVSASRPGARQESFDKYIERINALEDTAKSYKGVNSAFAMSAGRELRVLVDTEMVKDSDLGGMAKKIREQIEDEITYPGQIKVNVIRRTKHTETVN
jgi:ribonucrease Y